MTAAAAPIKRTAVRQNCLCGLRFAAWAGPTFPAGDGLTGLDCALRRALHYGGVHMPDIKVLAFQHRDVPRMLSSEAEIAAAIYDGLIAADTAVTLYLDNGQRRFNSAAAHAELAAYFPTAAAPEPAEEPVLDEPAFMPSQPDGSAQARRSPWTAQALPVSRGGLELAPASPLVAAAPPRVFGGGERGAITPPHHRTSKGGERGLFYWMIQPYRRYADFTGRAGRAEFWSFVLMLLVVTLLLTLFGGPNGGMAVLLALLVLGSVVPFVAVMVRRLHDFGASGWLVLVLVIPWLGSLAMFVAMLIPSQSSTNKYGEVP